ncbi:MAG: glycosyltransferase, partial [Cetobacterium sp.]
EGLSDIVSDGGLLFKAGDVQDLVQKILSLSDKDFYSEKSKSGIKKSLAYSIETMSKKYLDLYKEALECSSSR